MKRSYNITTGSTIRVGQKIPKEILKLAKKQYREADRTPPVYDPDCPPSTPETLVEFTVMMRELWKSRRNPSPVAIRVKPDTLSKYKALVKDYTSIMADVLNYVAENPEILSRAFGQQLPDKRTGRPWQFSGPHTPFS